jgi:excisionase family DNA binding protein
MTRKSTSRIAVAAMRGRSVNKLRTMDEVAEILGLSKRSVQRLVATGALRVHRLGRAVRISDSDLAALLAETYSW